MGATVRGLEPSSPLFLPTQVATKRSFCQTWGLGVKNPHNGNTSLWLGDLTKLGLNPDAGTCELHGLGQDLDLCVSFLLNWRSLCLSYRL